MRHRLNHASDKARTLFTLTPVSAEASTKPLISAVNLLSVSDMAEAKPLSLSFISARRADNILSRLLEIFESQANWVGQNTALSEPLTMIL